MARVIWKFALDKGVVVHAPRNLKPLFYGLDPHCFPAVWAEVDPLQPAVEHRFAVYGTGWEIPELASYVGSMVNGAYVWHLYYLGEF